MTGFLKGETANIRIVCDSEDVPVLEASVPNDPDNIGEARQYISDLHRHLVKPRSKDALREDVVEFLDSLIAYGVTDVSRDSWNDTLEGMTISNKVRSSISPQIQLDLQEMQEISAILIEEIPKARNRIPS